MALEAILNAIREEGQAGADEIRSSAEDEAARIIAQAERDAAAIKQDTVRAFARRIEADRARIVHRARLEVLQIVGRVQHAIVDRALGQVECQLANIRSDPAYGALYRTLLLEALAAVEGSLREGEQPRLLADPRDRAHVERELQDLNLDAPVAYELECWGGLQAISPDGLILVDNTLESRLANARPHLHRYLPSLFETSSVAELAADAGE
jgi:vacuolar-type H+-ATPase subunit E/Vma4